MVSCVLDPQLEEALIEQRRAAGADKFDEVWEGVYMMSPLAGIEHQEMVAGFTNALYATVQLAGLGRVFPGINIADREDDWKQNYRCPDVVALFNDNKAQIRETHLLGGPDFVVEIVSPHDQSREKLGFYSSVGTREVLLVDRDPWALELYRHDGQTLVMVQKATLAQPATIASNVVPLTLQLAQGEKRPVILAAHTDGKQHWTV